MASKRHQRRKQCGGKVRHQDHVAAMAAMHSLIQSGKKRGGWLHVYRCPFCHGWHVGHSGKGALK